MRYDFKRSIFVLLVLVCSLVFSSAAFALPSDRSNVGLPEEAQSSHDNPTGKSANHSSTTAHKPDGNKPEGDSNDKKDKKKSDKSKEKKVDEEKKQRDFSKKDETLIRVGIARGQDAAVMTAGDGFVVRDESTDAGLVQFKKGEVLTVSARGRQMFLNGKAISAKSIKVMTSDPRSSMKLSYANSPYHGHFVIRLTSDGLTVINVVGLDDYIAGVLDEEMGSDWPQEALKAQAVAARTFAMYSMKKHESDGFDVCADTHCQVYGGIASESKSGLLAVSATRGEIMTYDDKPIYAAFHASAGGWTAGSEEAGGNAVPYLRSVRSDDMAAPNANWRESFTVDEVTRELKSAGYNIGTLKKIELSPLDEEKVSKHESSKDRYPSGRVKEAKFVGSLKTVAVEGTKLRWIFSLNSTRFDIRLGDEKSSKPNKSGVIEIKKPGSDKITFNGYGFGHGMGMSQWGAYKMAAKHGYHDILNHYYSNVSFKKLF
ncbi:MAG: SpoIID/LytB domain-containing protein [Schwartzia sp.]|nr:SpoIID/LytB domain-containing protein [Schwartzia sp. (in: firmicutes)]